MATIAIIGFMAVGKTSVAKLLAGRLNYEMIDTDEWIAEEQDRSISEIFAASGEDYFRQLERDMLLRCTQMDKVVIATGGGAVLSAKNRELLKERCFVISFTSSPQVILKRVQADGHTRPLLHSDSEGPYQRICRLQDERKNYYQEADLTIDTSEKSLLEIVEFILAELHAKGLVQ